MTDLLAARSQMAISPGLRWAKRTARQALTYVSSAVPDGDGTRGLQSLDVAGRART